MKKLIQQGAEAKIYEQNNVIIKDRFKKRYRIKVLDDKIRKSRTKREAKVIERLYKSKIPVPKLIQNKETVLIIEKIKGKQLNLYLGNNLTKEKEKFIMDFGKILAKVHDSGVIHGDLTTSNMIVNTDENKIYLIDFGLSFFSDKIEDKAVDIHLFKQAVESKHYKIWRKVFDLFLKGYSHSRKYQEVIKRFELVETRGRNKLKSKKKKQNNFK